MKDDWVDEGAKESKAEEGFSNVLTSQVAILARWEKVSRETLAFK